MPKRTVLIVEDDPDIRETLKDVLEHEGFHVYMASNGKEGLALLGKIPGPCLILLDLLMPQMNGFDFIKALEKRNQDVLVEIPIIAVTAANPPEVPHAVKHLIKKPLDIDELSAVVRTYCDSNVA